MVLGVKSSRTTDLIINQFLFWVSCLVTFMLQGSGFWGRSRWHSRLIGFHPVFTWTTKSLSDLDLTTDSHRPTPHLDICRDVRVSVSCLCSAPSAVHSCFRNSARLSHTPASPASESRWPHSGCLCPLWATATRQTHINRRCNTRFCRIWTTDIELLL